MSDQANLSRWVVYRIASLVLKIGLASLIVGVVLSGLNVTPEQVLTDIGITPEQVLEMFHRGVTWAVPHILLGSIVIVPVWIIIYLFRPPRG
jgi:hypothetical protein